MDLSKYTDKELEAIAMKGGAGDLSAFSDADLEAIAMSGKPETAKKRPEGGGYLEGLARSYGQGASFGFGDEVVAEIASRVSQPILKAMSRDIRDQVSYGRGEIKQQVLAEERRKNKQFQEEYPASAIASELVGSIGTGGAAASKIGGQSLGRLFRLRPTATSAGIGAISGGLYGFGAGEGDAGERLGQAGVSAGLGAAIGPAGSYLGSKIGSLASKIGQKTPAKGALSTIEEAQSLADVKQAPKTDQSVAAEKKVIDALKKQYPDDYKNVIELAKNSGVPLAQIVGERIERLARGAAQYPGGSQVAVKYFDEQILSSPERIKQAISKNISGVDTYFATADQLLEAGRKRAAPIYERAYKNFVKDQSVLLVPEIQAALRSAYKKYPSELSGIAPDSIKALDYAKREIDDQIGSAVRSGESNFARSRASIKNQLLQAMDDASPDYRLARETSGDYLKIDEAINLGRDFMKIDPEQISLKNMSEAERSAFKIGVGKRLRDTIDNTTDGRNPYNKVFGSEAQRKRLMQILSPEEFQSFEKSLKAEDRIFKMKNAVLGNSQTVGKAIDAADIAAGGELVEILATGSPKGIGIAAILSGVRKAFDGISDDSARAISELLYETDPQKKIILLERIGESKRLTPAERQSVKQNYFKLDNFIKSRAAGAASAPAIMEE